MAHAPPAAPARGLRGLQRLLGSCVPAPPCPADLPEASGLMPPPDLPFWALGSSSTDFQGPLLPDFRFPASTWQSSAEQDLSLQGCGGRTG